MGLSRLLSRGDYSNLLQLFLESAEVKGMISPDMVGLKGGWS
jgi:hypothetical protein